MLIPNDLHQFDENLAENSPNLSIRVPQKKKNSHDNNQSPYFESSTLRLKTESSDISIPKSPNSKSSSKEE